MIYIQSDFTVNLGPILILSKQFLQNKILTLVEFELGASKQTSSLFHNNLSSSLLIFRRIFVQTFLFFIIVGSFIKYCLYLVGITMTKRRKKVEQKLAKSGGNVGRSLAVASLTQFLTITMSSALITYTFNDQQIGMMRTYDDLMLVIQQSSTLLIRV